MLPDQFIEVDADSEEAAQEQAFAKHVRDLSPAHFVVCGEEWAQEETA